MELFHLMERVSCQDKARRSRPVPQPFCSSRFPPNRSLPYNPY